MESSDLPPPEAKTPAASGEPSSDPRVGSTLAERYRIYALLGEGGMGKVYLGEHVLMRKRVAIKVLHKELTNLTDVVKRFEREAMAAANIDHPNVAGATDFGKLQDGSVFLVLEYVQGTSLRAEIAEGSFGLVRALHVGRQIASALAGAQLRGIVHRDLKPENVMLVEKAGDPDFVKVLDFGIAKVPIQEVGERGNVRPGQVITKVGMIFGTPEYMAPEQALGQEVDGRADQYALGVILFEMLTGSRPYKSDTAVGMLGQQLQGPPPSLSERASHLFVPDGVESLVSRLLSADREQRFDSCQELVEAFETQLLVLKPSALIRGSRPEASAQPPLVLEGPASSRRVPFSPISIELQPGESGYAEDSAPPSHLAPSGPPRGLLQSFSNLPSQLTIALLGGLVIGAVAVMVVLGIASRSPKHVKGLEVSGRGRAVPAAVPTAFPKVPEAELVMARGQGITALEQLAQRYPSDSEIVIDIAKAQLAQGNCGACLGSIARALVVEGKVRHNAEVATLLWKSVQRRECTDSAMKLLEGPMASRGADILYDLSVTEAVKKDVRQRAAEYFTSGRYKAQGSPSLAVLITLRDATDCSEKLALLDRARVDGDDRLVPVLAALRERTGCGEDKSQDCFPCLRVDGRLESTIEMLKGRPSK